MSDQATNLGGGEGATTPVTVQLSEGKGFKVQPEYKEFFEKHPDVTKSIVEGDKTISKLSKELEALQQWKKENEPKLKEREPQAPDRFDDPEGHDKWVIEQAAKIADQKSRAVVQREREHTAEIQTAASLVEEYFGDEAKSLSPEAKSAFYKMKLEGLAEEMHQQGGILEDGTYKAGAVKAAFSTRYMNELISKAEKRGSGKMGDELEKSRNAPQSTPAGGEPQSYANVDEALNKNPWGTVQDAFKKVGEQVKERMYGSK